MDLRGLRLKMLPPRLQKQVLARYKSNTHIQCKFNVENCKHPYYKNRLC